MGGLLYIVFFILRDMYYLFRILSFLRGCRAKFKYKDELVQSDTPKDVLVRNFNEARNIAIQFYLDTKKSFSKDMDQGDDDDKNPDYDAIRILDMLEADEEVIEKDR